MPRQKDAHDILGLAAKETKVARPSAGSPSRGQDGATAGAPAATKPGRRPRVPQSNDLGQELISRSRLSRMNVITREMQALMSDQLPPIAVVDPRHTLKASLYRRGVPVKKWRQTPFLNPARSDGLVLSHWTRLPDRPSQTDPAEQVGGSDLPNPPTQPDDEDAEKDKSEDDTPMETEVGKVETDAAITQASTTEVDADHAVYSDRDAVPEIQTEYPFAHYDADIWVPSYSDSEYDTHFATDGWTRAETDYLLDLIKHFGYRWALVYDRYEYPLAMGQERSRPVEELKSRFYTVWAKSIELNTPGGIGNLSDAQFALFQSLQAYNPSADAIRRTIAAELLTRSPEEVAEETQILGELQRIVTYYGRVDSELRDLRHRIDAPVAAPNHPSYHSSASLSTLFTNLLHAERVRRRNRAAVAQLDTASANAAAAPTNRTPTSGAPPTTGLNSATGGSSSGQAESAVQTPVTAEPSRKSVSGSATTRPAQQQAQQPAQQQSSQQLSTPVQNRGALSAQDELRFAVTTHDRLSSGVTFRSDRFVKMRQAKSQVQMHKISAALAELGVPEVIQLPTIAVCETFERLIQSINKLLDVRRAIDRYDNEIKVAITVREARLKREANPGSDDTSDEKESDNQESADVSVNASVESTPPPPPQSVHKRTPSAMNGGSSVGGSAQKRAKRG